MPRDPDQPIVDYATPPAVTHNLVVRDWNQTVFGNSIPLDHPALLKVYGLIADFNQAGDVKIASVEGPSGAQFQMDIMYGRDTLQSLRNIHDALKNRRLGREGMETEMRLLVRGPYAVGLEALNKDDLMFVMRNMAEAAGARQGRPVVFKLFEAQNMADEYAATVRNADKLRRGGYNVSVEIALCYTADEKLGHDYYQKLADGLLPVLQDPSLHPSTIRRISIKDMSGYLGDTERIEDGSAAAVMKILASVADRFHENTGRTIELALHSHHVGRADAANVIAASAVRDSKASSITLDTIPGGLAFADMQKVMQRNAALGNGPAPSATQIAILGEMTRIIRRLETAYSYTAKASNAWTDDELLFARLPSGAKPDAYGKVVAPVAAQLGDRYPGLSEDQSTKLAAQIFMHVNRWMAHQNGNASAVTPGAKHLYTLTKTVMSEMVATGFTDRFDRPGQGGGIDLTMLGSRDPASGRYVETAWRDQLWEIAPVAIAKHYAEVTAPAEYFRSRMPQPVEPRLMEIYAAGHLHRILRDARAAGFDHAPVDMAAIRQEILAKPTDKQHAETVLTAHGVPAEKARRFAAVHVGLDSHLRDAGKRIMHAVTEHEVAAMQTTGTLAVSAESAATARIVMGGANWSADARRLAVKGTSPADPVSWAGNFVDWPKLTQRWIDATQPVASGDPRMVAVRRADAVTEGLNVFFTELNGRAEPTRIQALRQQALSAVNDSNPEIGLFIAGSHSGNPAFASLTGSQPDVWLRDPSRTKMIRRKRVSEPVA